ncbi:ATP-binding cassette, subfamily F, member 3 [Enteropsectra breve]|nr:ATP-binding cassette, subfamily F, member 3 [Enteropsectra breve]
MKSLHELIDSYRMKLRDFPFATKEEAAEQGVENYTLADNEQYSALETPYTMKQHAKIKHVEKDEDEDYVEEDSSEGESSSETPFYGDLQLDMDLFVKGKQIIDNSTITITRNAKYGLVGRNGIGKTTLLKAIRKRKFGIPKGLKIHAIKQDYVSDEKVIDFVGADAGKILSGMGFTKEKQEQTLRSLSGGWRMRAQIAKAVHINPDLLLLDEPTNFLDIKSILYLENKIKDLKTVIIVSHDKKFLNNTVDHILHLNEMKIAVHRGNYDAFVHQCKSARESQVREYENQMAQRAHLQSFIDRFRYSASRSAQAQSKIKMLEKMPVLQLPKIPPSIKFSFSATPADGMLLELEKIKFGYEGTKNKLILDGLNLRIKNRDRIVIVGENGQGKSTLLKLLAQKMVPTAGVFDKNPNLRVGYFAQHHIDHLQHSEHVLSFMMKSHREDVCRQALASFGLNIGNQKIGTLSGGQKSRLAFALLNFDSPNLLLLDEPTNHLDMETIEALGHAINAYEGAVVCVSHDMAFIESAFKSVYICEAGKLLPYSGTIESYKKSLI